MNPSLRAKGGRLGARWKRFRHRLEWLGCLFLRWALPLMPHRAIRVLAELMGTTVYALDIRGRQVTLSNLEVVFGEGMSEAERERVALGSYRNFALTMLELFWGQGIPPERFGEMTIVRGFSEALERAAREDRGLAFLCPHYANWEWAALAFAQVGGRASIVAQDFKNPLLTPLFAQMRQHRRHTLLSQDRAMLKLLKCVRRGEAVAILPDLNLPPEEGGVLARVFGPDPLEVCVTPLQSVLGLRGNALLVPVLIDRLADGRISVEASRPVEFDQTTTVEEIVQRTWAVYEPVILRKPELWLWAYKHFRFRPEKGTRAYPFYARHNSRFEAMRGGISEGAAAGASGVQPE